MEIKTEHVKQKPVFTLKRFHISEDYGFLSPNPLEELPPFYSPWTEIAHKLTYLVENHQLRLCVNKMPLLSTQYLHGHQELYLAHLVLSFITMGYVWQEGEKGVTKVLPRNLAIPFGEVSQMLGLPPILVHADFVLVNWKKKNPYGPLEIENLEPIFSVPGGTSSRGFILVSILVEKAAAPGLQAMAKTVTGLLQPNEELLIEALPELTNTLQEMTKIMKKMHDYVDPSIFYGVTRIFFSGWKDNPALPDGILYEGLCENPLAYSGGSAAQSSILHAFDELLGIKHSKESAAFLHRMRKYMPPPHQAFLEEIQRVPPLKCHILSSGNKELQSMYNQCVAALTNLRTYHITLITKYIVIAARKAQLKPSKMVPAATSPPSFLEGRGTGGSWVLSFLKSVRDTTREAMINL